MKLLTTIPARVEGTVIVDLPVSRLVVSFEPDPSGALVADVESPADVAALLKLGTFEPYDEGDFAAAEALLGPVDDPADDPEGLQDDPDDFSEAPAGGLPLESNTPPKAPEAPAPAPAPAAKKSKAG